MKVTAKDKNNTLPITLDSLKKIYINIITARILDAKMSTMLKQGKSFFHMGCSGHEAVQAAFAAVLQPGQDWAFPYYRDLAFVLQYGFTPKDVLLGFLSRSEDPSSGGRQMPHHYGHKSLRIVTQSSPTGSQYLQAVGCALGAVKENKNEVVYVSSGEGATAQGDFHEAINWAARDRLPVIFLIQNNKYAISVHIENQLTGGSPYNLTAGYKGLNRFKIDGTDLIACYQTAKQAAALARQRSGPVLIDAETVRLVPHSSSDADKKYRKSDEMAEERLQDPIVKIECLLLANHYLTPEAILDMKNEVKNAIDALADETEGAAKPKAETAGHFLYAPEQIKPVQKALPSTSEIVMVDAINHALQEEMVRNHRIYVFGQDVADAKGGVFSATQGLSTKFGAERCFNAPLAESSIIGIAVGMAVRGLKPVVEIQFADYIWTAMMQIRNELTTIRWRSNNQWTCPVVIRTPVGGYIHGGLCHSQNIEAIFSHFPGILIAYPSNAADAKAMLKYAIRCEDPVLFLEHKGLYRQNYAKAPEPHADYILPFGQASIIQSGSDISVITYGSLVHMSLLAAAQLVKEGIQCEVIDLRSIVPLDMMTIINSIKKTGKVLIAHEDSLFQGFGAEIAAQISENAFEYLDAPVKRVAGKDLPIAYSDVLEKIILPQTEDLIEAGRVLANY
jgi:2-oxoisovalerate dehydrogenase E1 component